MSGRIFLSAQAVGGSWSAPGVAIGDGRLRSRHGPCGVWHPVLPLRAYTLWRRQVLLSLFGVHELIFRRSQPLSAKTAP